MLLFEVLRCSIKGANYYVIFLKKTTPSKKGVYLQIYQGYYIPKVGKRNKSFKKIGYVSDLISQGIKDPIEHFQKEVDILNQQESDSVAQITDVSTSKFAGHFLIKAMLNKLNVKETMDIMNANFKVQYNISDLLEMLIYAQILSPGSKLKAFEKLYPIYIIKFLLVMTKSLMV